MITWAKSLHIGNAIHLVVTPRNGARRWRILRRTADVFTGHDDAGAVVVHDGRDNSILDAVAVEHGVTYFYREYWFDGIAWHDGGGVEVTDDSTYSPSGVYVPTFLRERLELGLAREIALGRLQPASGKISVLTAPPLVDDVDFPVVTLRLDTDTAAEHFIGDTMALDEFDDSTGEWAEADGWFGKTQITITGWSINPDERLAMMRSIRDVLIANLPVFGLAGMSQVETSQTVSEDFETFSAPVYMSMTVFSCLSANIISGSVPAISDVTVAAL